jgi:hypothetical protein
MAELEKEASRPLAQRQAQRQSKAQRLASALRQEAQQKALRAAQAVQERGRAVQDMQAIQLRRQREAFAAKERLLGLCHPLALR